MDAKRSGTLPPDVKTTKKGGVPDMLGIGGLIRSVTGMGTIENQSRKKNLVVDLLVLLSEGNGCYSKSIIYICQESLVVVSQKNS